MARVKNNIITQGMSGTLGGTLVFKQVGNETIVSTMPTQSEVVTVKQKAQRTKFQEAVFYAKGELGNPQSKSEYEQAAKLDGDPFVHAYNVALADFLNAPDIKSVDLSNYTGNIGDTIEITVVDDFKVVDVTVSIINGDGSLVENGNAVQQANINLWVYTATAANASLAGDKIVVKAHDKPGNEDSETLTL